MPACRITGLGLWPILALTACQLASAQVTVTSGSQFSVDVAADGRVAMDLRGDLWVVPSSGGDASQLTQNLNTARRPRWSPDATRLAYQANDSDGSDVWIVDVKSNTTTRVSSGPGLKFHPRWHPSGERLLYSADVDNKGFDVWELDIETGLKWRITQRPGDETEAAWSASGRDLVYVSQHKRRWSLVLRRHGQREEVLLSSMSKLAAPSWRPDGSLITFFEERDGKPVLQMVILSQPRLIRTYDDRERFVVAPVSWRNRQQMVYVANGEIRRRRFNAWSSSPLRFRATLQPPPDHRPLTPRPEFVWQDEPQGELVIHAARMFDGLQSGYQSDLDIILSGGRIAAIEPHRQRPGRVVVDMGDLTIVPGSIDADARLPTDLAASHGPDLLAMGVTTIVGATKERERLALLWSGKAVPGPRLLDNDTWNSGPLAPPDLDVTAAVSTSAAMGQATGVALPMQLRALQYAGLNAEQSLRALGVNAAGAIRADPYVGRIAVGSAADMVFVDGDPLSDSADLLNVVAVVRNGRFYSVSGLFDRAKSAENVE